MSAQGASKVAGGIALAAVLSVVAIVAWSMLNQSDPAPSAPVADGPAMGDITGYVGRVDRNARTIDVAENMFGLRPVTMALTNDTSIMVSGKQGGIGDLSKDMQVRAFYEVRNDVKYLTSIQVITEDAQAKVASSAPADSKNPIEAKPAAQTKPQREAKPPVETRSSVESKPSMDTKPVAPPPVASAPPATRPPAPAAPVMSVTPKPPTPPSADVRPVPPRVTDPAPASLETAARPALAPPRPAAPKAEAASPPSLPSSPAAAARPADTDGGDGSAAIDWLLKESRRR